MKYTITIKKIIFSLVIFVSLSKSQDIALDGEIYEYATYYVNSFDFNTGATNVQIFRYVLTSTTYPIQINGKRRAEIVVPNDLSPKEIEAKVLSLSEVKNTLGESKPKKIIVVPGRIVNVVF